MDYTELDLSNLAHNVKAYLKESDEFFKPDGRSFADLSVFYGILAGYQSKGQNVKICFGSEIEDREGIEVFTGDLVEVYARSNKTGNYISETGVVVFEEGCFLVRNDEGMDFELSMCADSEDMYAVIIGNIYNEKTPIGGF